MKFPIPYALVAAVMLLSGIVAEQASQAPPVVRAIAAAKKPLPPEDASASVTKFSYIVYGDTRGRRDGVELQYEHGLVVDGMLAAIKQLETTEYPVRWVLQTGDAVVNGGDARQWNNSFIGLVNRLTIEGGVPYFLAPGNHDVTAADSLQAPQRQQGLQNYLKAMAELIPPDNAPRRLAGYPTYAFGYGNTFILALDSNIANDATQFDWARKQLEGLNRNRYINVIATFHHPVFSSGPHGGPKLEAPSAALRTRYMPLFRAHHVRAVFAGHDHLFEHWVERYMDSAGRHRMDLVTTGGGGAPIYTYQGEPDVSQYLKENQASGVVLEHVVKPGPATGDNPYHFVVVRVDGDRMDLQVVGVDWGSGWRPYRSNRSDLNDAH
ncbi:MAG TPA: metallophosphoesterase [Terriglobia bacterium]|nr:metallophosphoesterase [Terriglobia bacterium]